MIKKITVVLILILLFSFSAKAKENEIYKEQFENSVGDNIYKGLPNDTKNFLEQKWE